MISLQKLISCCDVTEPFVRLLLNLLDLRVETLALACAGRKKYLLVDHGLVLAIDEIWSSVVACLRRD